jgi:hypothetical protein
MVGEMSAWPTFPGRWLAFDAAGGEAGDHVALD